MFLFFPYTTVTEGHVCSMHAMISIIWIALMFSKMSSMISSQTVTVTRSDPYVDRRWHWVWMSITPNLHKSVIPLMIWSGFMCFVSCWKSWLKITKLQSSNNGFVSYGNCRAQSRYSSPGLRNSLTPYFFH